METTGSKELRRSRLSMGCKTIQWMECKQTRLKDVNSYFYIAWLLQLSVLQESFLNFHLNALNDLIFLFLCIILPLCRYIKFSYSQTTASHMKLYSYGILDYYPLFNLYLCHTKQSSFYLFIYTSLGASDFLVVDHV